MADLFAYNDYKEYLNTKLDEIDDGRRGARARMSRIIGCQTAYTTQVLRGTSHFSLEQAEAINHFLGHTEDQGLYFLLLVQLAKAGTRELRARFKKQIEEIQQNRQNLKNRLHVSEYLAEHQQLVYYSHWLYGAVHAAASIPELQTPEKISQRLNTSVRQVAEVLQFLLSSGLLVKTENGRLEIGRGQLHLGADSPLISKHHINWRLQAMRAVEQDPQAGLHYSSVISISREDQNKIREKLISALQEIKPLIRDSKEEDVCSLCIDFYSI